MAARYFPRKVIVTFAALQCMICIGCKETPPGPPPQPTNCEYPAGNRNFTWRSDTVAWFPSTVAGVWAFSDSDAYVMGYIVDGRPPYTLRAGRHWNGRIWEDNINGTWAFDGDIKIDPRNDLAGDDHFMVSVGWYGISTTVYAGVAEFDNRTKRWTSYQFPTVGELRSVWTDGKGFFVAAGDNGMVYTKDGYTANWVYSQAPTTFNFTKIIGVSKQEIYSRATRGLASGLRYYQIWRFSQNTFTKLLDTQDTTGTPIRMPEMGAEVNDIEVHRCTITDSLSLYVTGTECFEFRSKGDFLIFRKTVLGLPSSTVPWGRIFLFTPSDYWLTRLEYHMYHWNGSNFQKIEPIPELPYGQLWGATSHIRRNQSGKTWMVVELSSQVYAVLKGKP